MLCSVCGRSMTSSGSSTPMCPSCGTRIEATPAPHASREQDDRNTGTPTTLPQPPAPILATSMPGPKWGAAHGGEKLPTLPVPPPISPLRRHARPIGIGALIAVIVVIGFFALFHSTPTPRELIAYDGSLSAPTVPFPQETPCFSASDGYHIVGSHVCTSPVIGTSFTVKVAQASGVLDHGYGIVFRFQDEYHFYLFYICGDGTWGYEKVVGGVATFPVHGQASSALHRGLHAVNEISVHLGASGADFSINGTKVGQGDTAEFDYGDWGLSGSDGVEVVYTHLKVTQPA